MSFLVTLIGLYYIDCSVSCNFLLNVLLIFFLPIQYKPRCNILNHCITVKFDATVNLGMLAILGGHTAYLNEINNFGFLIQIFIFLKMRTLEHFFLFFSD